MDFFRQQAALRIFRRYLAAVGFGAFAMGLQTVMYPWLVIGVLGAGAEKLALAQAAIMLPNLMLILVGGALSDRMHLPSWLFRLYLSYVLPLSGLLLAAAFGWFSYHVVLSYGLLFGIITSMTQPARETRLSQVACYPLQQTVARVSFVQFICQSGGVLVAGQLDRIGWQSLVVLQATAFVFGAFFLRGTRSQLEVPEGGGEGRFSIREIYHGLAWVHRNKRMFHLMLLVAATGFLGMGVYLVLIPIMAREVYHQDASFYAMLQISFIIGVLATNLMVMRRVNSIRNSGRLLVLSLLLRGLVLLLVSRHLPVGLLIGAMFLWGNLSGLSMTIGRSMAHSESPDSHRARVISVYQLSLFGAAPLGAWCIGSLISWQGTLVAVEIVGTLTLVAALIALRFSELWKLPTRAEN